GDRAKLLRRFAAVVDEHVDELADLEVRNSGHTIGNARWEAGNVRDVLDYYAGGPEPLSGRQRAGAASGPPEISTRAPGSRGPGGRPRGPAGCAGRSTSRSAWSA